MKKIIDFDKAVDLYTAHIINLPIETIHSKIGALKEFKQTLQATEQKPASQSLQDISKLQDLDYANYIYSLRSNLKTKPLTNRNKQFQIKEFCQFLTKKNYVSTDVTDLHDFQKLLKQHPQHQTLTPLFKPFTLSKIEKKNSAQSNTLAAFSAEELSLIFKTENLKSFKQPQEYFGLLMQLYTGARVSEICGLKVSDFIQKEGYPCIHIESDESHKSNRIDLRSRTIPLHPDLIKIGLLDFVKDMKQQGHERIFPHLLRSANGYGGIQNKFFRTYFAGIQEHIKEQKAINPNKPMTDIQDSLPNSWIDARSLDYQQHAKKLGTDSFAKTFEIMIKSKNIRGAFVDQYLGKTYTGDFGFGVHEKYNYSIQQLVDHVVNHIQTGLDIEKLPTYVTGQYNAVIEHKTQLAAKRQEKYSL